MTSDTKTKTVLENGWKLDHKPPVVDVGYDFNLKNLLFNTQLKFKKNKKN